MSVLIGAGRGSDVLSQSTIDAITTVFEGRYKKDYWEKFTMITQDGMNAANAMLNLDRKEFEKKSAFTPTDVEAYVRHDVIDYKSEYEHAYEGENPILQLFGNTFAVVYGLPIVRDFLKESLGDAEYTGRDGIKYQERLDFIGTGSAFETAWFQTGDAVNCFMLEQRTVNFAIGLIEDVVFEPIDC